MGRDIVVAVPEFQAQGFIDLLDRVYQTGETYFGAELPFVVAPADGDPARQVPSITVARIRTAVKTKAATTTTTTISAQLCLPAPPQKATTTKTRATTSTMRRKRSKQLPLEKRNGTTGCWFRQSRTI